ncbi:Snf7-domain-containing protein [Lactarius sanguifluus]|nr:Snf7-domain-containing protein [Lactarius sanguifluus]
MGGSQSTPKITAQDRAILDLKLQRDKLKQYQKKIQIILDREHEIAKQQLAAGHKDRAIIALRRRKYQEGLLVKTDGQLESLEQLVSTIEFSLVEVSVLHGLKQGNAVLKEIHKELNVESVERLLEETAEAREYQREIDNMLVNNLSLDEEDAVQAELKELQQEALRAQRDEETAPSLPDAPTTEPVSSEQGVLRLILLLASLTWLYEDEIQQPQEETRTERVAISA